MKKKVSKMLSSQMPNKMARPQMPQRCLSDGDTNRPLSQISAGSGKSEIHNGAQKVLTESKTKNSDESDDDSTNV